MQLCMYHTTLSMWPCRMPTLWPAKSCRRQCCRLHQSLMNSQVMWLSTWFASGLQHALLPASRQYGTVKLLHRYSLSNGIRGGVPAR